MRTILSLLVALVLALGAAPGVRAQYVMDIGNLIAAIQVGDLNDAVEGVHRANRVYVARLSELSGLSTSGDILTRTIVRRQGVLRYFRSAIRGAAEARRALEIHGESLDDVVFATFTNDRTATLYVDDR